MRKEIQTRQVVANYTTRHKRKLMNAQLGNNAGVVETGTADFWWIRLHGDDNQVVRARSSRDVVPNAGIDVVVELVQREGLPYYQILGRALGILYPTEPYANRVVGHHEQHEQGDAGAGGFDPVSVFPRMVAPLRAHEETVPAMTVYVDAGDAAIGSTHLRFLGGSSPAFSNPTTFNRFDLLYLGTDNALHVLAGTEASGWVTPTRPTMTTTGVPIAWVLLTASMTTILEGDIYDAGILRTGVGLSTINDESVLHDKVGSPALFTLHDDWITRGSSGVIDGTQTYVTVGSTAVKISVIAGDGYVRLTNDQQGELVFCHWNASADIYTFSAPAAGQENVIFIGVEYAAGNVTAVTKTAFTDWNWFTNFPLARASYDGTTMRIVNLYAHAEDTANFARKVLRLTHPFEREEAPEGSGGLEISDVATRQIAMTAGRIWHGFNNLILNAIAAGTTFYTYYRRAGGGFNNGTATQWENTLYEDGSGTLQTMTNNRYGTRWIYLDVSGNTVGSAYNGSLAMVYGTSNATSVALAQAEAAPSIPSHLQYHGRLIGRIVFQKSAAAASVVESAWTNAFAATAVGNHNLLSGLQGGTTNEYYHLTNAEATGLLLGNFTTLHKHYLIHPLGTGSISADLNDFDVSSVDGSFLRIDVASVNLTGLAGGVDGKMAIIKVDPTGTGVIVIKYDNGGSLANNRIYTQSGGDVTIPLGGTAIFQYRGTKWRLISIYPLTYANLLSIPATFAPTAHNLLSSSHGDTTAAAAVRGDIITAQGASPTWTRLAKGAQYTVLGMGANEPAWSGFLLDGTAGGKTVLAVTNTKTLTLTATDNYNLTIPATGTVVLTSRTLSVSGLGLSGLGDLSADRTLTLTSSSNPGAAAAILASDASGNLQIVGIGVGMTAAANRVSVLGDAGAVTMRKKTNATGNLYIDILDYNGTELGYFGYGSATVDFYLANLANGTMQFWTNSAAAITISTARAVRFHSYGAGTLVTDASGNITASSDERLKDIRAKFGRGIEAIRQLEPIIFKWKDDLGLDTQHEYVGFGADAVRRAMPEAVGVGADGYLTLSDRAILAAVINAIKELDARMKN